MMRPSTLVFWHDLLLVPMMRGKHLVPLIMTSRTITPTPMLDNIDGTYVEDVYDDEGVLAPNYDDHSTPYFVYDSYDDEDVMVPTYDGGWVFERPSRDMDPSIQEPCMEDTGVGAELGGEN
jgi:hypothetical protein